MWALGGPEGQNQVACRLHAVLCELVPGGIAKEISAGQATHFLAQVTPSGAAALARRELAAEFVDDMCHLDAQLCETRKKLAAAVKASGTTVTEIFGVGPVIAGTVIGDVADVSRFPGRDQFAAYNGTAPVEVSSGRACPRAGQRRRPDQGHMCGRYGRPALDRVDGRAFRLVRRLAAAACGRRMYGLRPPSGRTTLSQQDPSACRWSLLGNPRPATTTGRQTIVLLTRAMTGRPR